MRCLLSHDDPFAVVPNVGFKTLLSPHSLALTPTKPKQPHIHLTFTKRTNYPRNANSSKSSDTSAAAFEMTALALRKRKMSLSTIKLSKTKYLHTVCLPAELARFRFRGRKTHPSQNCLPQILFSLLLSATLANYESQEPRSVLEKARCAASLQTPESFPTR